MHNGTIKRIVQEKGFGFIDGSDGHSYFFHVSELAEGHQLVDWLRAIPSTTPRSRRRGREPSRCSAG